MNQQENNNESEKLSEEIQVDEIEADASGEAAAMPTSMKLMREIYDWVEIFVITLTVIFLVFTFLLRIAYVDGPSMNETLHDSETLVVSSLFYTPKQGDIVVFQSPDSDIYGGIVKRVIATEDQVVDIDFDTWTVTVNGEKLDEPYVNFEEGKSMLRSDVTFPVTVPKGCVFVMGDNRNHSSDSRGSRIGFLDTRFIFGHVLYRLTPLSRIGTID